MCSAIATTASTDQRFWLDAHASRTQIRQWTDRTGVKALYDMVVMYQRETLQARLCQSGCGWTRVLLIKRGNSLMSLSVHDATEGFDLSLEYDAALGSDTTARCVLGHLQRLLEEIARAEPDTALSGRPMLSSWDEAQVLALGRPSVLAETDPRDLATRFEAIAGAKARHTAIVEPATGRNLEFAQLDRMANGIARRLAAGGVEARLVVPIALPRCAKQIAAVLKLGAAFALLDLNQPGEYPAKLMRQVKACVLVADPASPLAAKGVPMMP